MDTEMGEGCRLLSGAEARDRHPEICPAHTRAVLWSPHEVRVESRTALPKLAAWLAQTLGVAFRTTSAVTAVAPPLIETSTGTIRAERAIVCPGDDLISLFPERIAAYGPTRCRLSMLRLDNPGFRLPGGVMSDLGLVRYQGYSLLPEAEALRRRLGDSHARHLAHGVHLIVVQSEDGSLVVGDSHHYDDTPDPFAGQDTEALILDEFTAATGLQPPPVRERWTGTYSSCADRAFFIDTPSEAVRLVMVTCGAGASTAFGIAEHTFAGF
jgi:FAD dependent oxidoreductase TIGR03364